MELVLFKESQNKEVSQSLELLFNEYEEKLKKIKEMSDSSSEYSDVMNYFLKSNELMISYSNLFDYEKAKAALNAEMWDKTINKTNVLKYMPAEDRNQWAYDIKDYKTPDFERDVVIATIHNLLGSQNHFFAKKVDGIFNKLSGNHVTNSPQGFNKKMIIERVVNSYGHPDSDVNNYIDDLRFVISKIIGITHNDFENKRTYYDVNNIINMNQYGKWFSIDGGLLRLKVFKKGTAHLEVFPSVALKLNQILAELHPMAIPAKHRESKKQYKEFELKQDFLNSSVLNELDKIIEKLRRGLSFSYYPSIKGEDRKKFDQIIQIIDGTMVNNYLSFSYDPSEVLMEIKMNGCIPERKSHQFYPTEDSLADLALTMINIDKWDTVLEPSAGNGRLVDKIQFTSKDRIQCVEISKTNCSVLKEKGYKVENMDFLKYSKENKFKKIIMNPPFTKNQAKMHVEKAFEHLLEEGKLVAIIPSSLRDKINIPKGYRGDYTDNIENAFLDSGTKVSVCIFRGQRK